MSEVAGVTIVAGVGPGLGRAVAERFADGGHKVALLARRAEALAAMASARADGRFTPMSCDVTDGAAVARAFARVAGELGTPDCVVFNADGWSRGGITELTAEAFERSWRVGCLGGFHVGQAAARAMLEHGGGAASCSPGPRLRSAAAAASRPSPPASSGSAPWPRAWRASWRPRASTSPT
jgi:NAD(P)-dependent dehydrogenase (short-subunit alcohol dehydrogenase family)